MKKLFGIAAVLAGLGAAAWWLNKNVDVNVHDDNETPEEKEKLDAELVEEQKEAEGNPIKTAVVNVKNWLHRHVTVTRNQDDADTTEEAPEESADTEPEQPADAPVEEPADVPNPNPVEAAPAQPPVDEDGHLDATALAQPEDFADWDQQGCKNE